MLRIKGQGYRVWLRVRIKVKFKIRGLLGGSARRQTAGAAVLELHETVKGIGGKGQG